VLETDVNKCSQIFFATHISISAFSWHWQVCVPCCTPVEVVLDRLSMVDCSICCFVTSLAFMTRFSGRERSHLHIQPLWWNATVLQWKVGNHTVRSGCTAWFLLTSTVDWHIVSVSLCVRNVRNIIIAILIINSSSRINWSWSDEWEQCRTTAKSAMFSVRVSAHRRRRRPVSKFSTDK